MHIQTKIVGSTLSGKLNSDFYLTPYEVNSELTNWIPPMRMQERSKFSFNSNPVWNYVTAKFWVAYHEGKKVGRLACIIHKNIKDNRPIGHFSYLCVRKEPEIIKVLFSVGENWLKSMGVRMVLGPFNPTINYELGILVNGFEDKPKFMMPYDPPFIDTLLHNLGYSKAHDFYAYQLNTNDFRLPDISNHIIQRYRKRFQIDFVNIDFLNLQQESQVVEEIYNDAFKDHWGAVPFHLDEIIYMAKELKSIVDPDLFFYLTLNNKKVGFILALPDLNEAIVKLGNGRLWPMGWYRLWKTMRSIKQIRVLNVALNRKNRLPGAGLLLYQELFTRLKNKGVTGGELSWVSESNVNMNGALGKIGAERKKTYRIYMKNLS